jgi:hypothetical protein
VPYTATCLKFTQTNKHLSFQHRTEKSSNILSYWDIPPSMHDKMHGHATIGQTSLFGCSSAGHSGINQLGGVYVNGMHSLLKFKNLNKIQTNDRQCES